MDTKKLRQKILDLAIHGKLVPQDPNDEPASVLLERIKKEKEQLIKQGKIKAPKKSKTPSDTSHYPKEVPFALPKGWVWCRGNDVFLPMESTSPQGEFFDYIDIDAIDNKHNIVTAPKHLPVKNAPSRATRLVCQGDVLFSMVRPYLRNIARVESDGCIASTGFYVCRCSNAIDSKYCYYLMLSDYVVEGLNQYMKGDNSPSINNNHITSWFYPIPPIAEQNRICNCIDSLFSMVDILSKDQLLLQKTIDLCRTKILDLAIHGKLVPQDPNDEPAIELLKRINPNFKPSDNLHYEECPRGWVVVRFKSIINLLSGRDIEITRCNSEGRGLPYLVGASCIEDGSLKFFRWTETPEEISKEGDVLLSCKGTVGEVLHNTVGDIHIARQFMAIRSKAPNYILPSYLEILIKASIEILKKAARGIIPGISREDILDLTVMIPPIDEQKRIISKIAYLNQLATLISSNVSD